MLTEKFRFERTYNTDTQVDFPMSYNAALRGEQRRPPNLNHCAVITEAESNPKCRALGIPLERFVM
ncbi:hypothetical protein CGJ29_24205 [Vibrio parahaemolyticus]|nr:hypothetical protein CGJ29_24205 [Vibrio parahaemolyticus]